MEPRGPRIFGQDCEKTLFRRTGSPLNFGAANGERKGGGLPEKETRAGGRENRREDGNGWWNPGHGVRDPSPPPVPGRRDRRPAPAGPATVSVPMLEKIAGKPRRDTRFTTDSGNWGRRPRRDEVWRKPNPRLSPRSGFSGVRKLGRQGTNWPPRGHAPFRQTWTWGRGS